MELMKELKDESIDAIITDPPYNINQAEWDNMGKSELKAFTTSYLKEFKRIIKPKHPILIFYTSGENFADFMQTAIPILNFKKLMVLYKPNDCSMPLESVLRTSEALTLWTSAGPINYDHEENVHDVLISNVEVEKGFWHPSVKNIHVIRKLVKAFTKEGSLVLDPFVGSGTTGVACKQTNRNFIGFDISQEYIDIAKRRLAQVQLFKAVGLPPDPQVSGIQPDSESSRCPSPEGEPSSSARKEGSLV